MLKSDSVGAIDVDIGGSRFSFKISDPETNGDGAVPADASGNDPESSPDVQQCYCLSGFEHQMAYNNEQVRLVLLHSLAKMAQKSSLVANLPFRRVVLTK